MRKYALNYNQIYSVMFYKLLRRPYFFCSRKRNRGKKTAHRGGLFTKTPSPMYPSSYTQNNSDCKKCQQYGAKRYVPISAIHFSAPGANTNLISVVICMQQYK